MFGLALWQPLLACLALALAMRTGALAKASAVLLADWLVGHVVFLATEDQFNLPVIVCTDIVAAEVLIVGMGTAMEALLVLSFAVEMIAHASYAVGSQSDWSRYHWWWAMHYMAWTQAAILAVWGGLDGGSRIRVLLDRSGHCRNRNRALGFHRSSKTDPSEKSRRW